MAVLSMGGRLPDENDLGQRPNPQGETGVIHDNSAEIVDNAIAGFGNTVESVGNKIADQQDRLQMTQARSSYLQADVAAREQVKNSTDWQSTVPTYQKAMQSAQQGALAMVRNNQNRAMLQAQLQDDFAQGSSQVANIADNLRQNSNRAALIQSNDGNRQAAALAPDSKTRMNIIDSTLSGIDAALKAKTISPVEAVEMRQQEAANFDTDFIKMLPLTDTKNADGTVKKGQISTLQDSLKKHDGYLPGDYVQPVDRNRMLEAAKTKLDSQNNGLKSDLRADVSNGIAVLEAGYPLTPDQAAKLTPARIKAIDPDNAPEYNYSVQQAQSRGSAINNMAKMPVMDILKTMNNSAVKGASNHMVDDERNAAVISQAGTQIINKLKDDPWGFLQDDRTGSAYAPVFKELLQNQDPEQAKDIATRLVAATTQDKQRIGLSTNDVLPSAYIDKIIDGMSKVGNNQNLAQTVAAQAQIWGDNWPRVMAQMKNEGKLSSALMVLGQTDIPDKARNELASTVLKTPKEMEAMVPKTPGVTEKHSIDEPIDTGMAAYRSSMGQSGVTDVAAMRDAIRRTSLVRMANGSSAADATSSAINDYLGQNRLSMVTQHSGDVYRIPLSRLPDHSNPESIQDGADVIRKNFMATPDMIGATDKAVKDARVSNLTSDIRTNGYWRTDQDNGGLNFFVNGQQVRDPNTGKPVFYSWASLQGAHDREISRIQGIKKELRDNGPTFIPGAVSY